MNTKRGQDLKKTVENGSRRDIINLLDLYTGSNPYITLDLFEDYENTLWTLLHYAVFEEIWRLLSIL